MQVKIDKIFNYSAIGACIVLFFLAVLTFCDVFGRRFLNSHVSADFINQIDNNLLKKIIIILKFIFMISIMSMMAYATTLSALEFTNNGRVTLELELYFYPFLQAQKHLEKPDKI